ENENTEVSINYYAILAVVVKLVVPRRTSIAPMRLLFDGLVDSLANFEAKSCYCCSFNLVISSYLQFSSFLITSYLHIITNFGILL
ncbi:hypothetical protein L9F63_019704, partial [Diploptera punctata]